MINKVPTDHQQAVADALAAGTGGVAIASWTTLLDGVLHIAVTVVAIVAGSFAAWWHYEKALSARKERLSGSNKTEDSR